MQKSAFQKSKKRNSEGTKLNFTINLAAKKRIESDFPRSQAEFVTQLFKE